MRQLALLLVVASACGGSSMPPRTVPTGPTADPEPKPPEAKVVDDSWYVNARGIRERVVVSRTAEGWSYESTATLTGPPDVSTRLLVFTDEAGAFQKGQFLQEASAEGRTETLRIDLRREGDLVIAEQEGARPQRVPAGQLFVSTQMLGQMASLCRLAAPATITAIGQDALTLGTPETLDGGVTRTRIGLGSRQGSADLYCEGERVLAIDGPGAEMHAREADEERYEALRRPRAVKPAPPDGVVEEETTVAVKATGDVPAATLACSLVTRAGAKGKSPGVVLLSGDGFDDRDNDPIFESAKRAFHRHLAYQLAGLGVASLRCDDRGIGGSDGGRIITAGSLTADATATVAALRADKRIDKKRVGLVAVGETAQVAPRVWKAAPLDALVLIEPHNRRLDDVLAATLEVEMKAVGAPQDAIDAERKRLDEALAAVRAGKPLGKDAPGLAQQVFDGAGGDYFRSFLDYDVAAAAAKVNRTAVLLVDAVYDDGSQIVPREDLEALAAAFKKAKGKKKNVVEARTVPEIDSRLVPREAGDEGSAAPAWAPVASALVDEVARFLSQHL
jgi:hypothetical protein